jgi:glycosyltransferase involved in cell wall biosynthesis
MKRAKDTQGIYFTGRQMEDELLAFYAFAAACIVPSELDPWALVVNEAMASGLPVIVSKGCGSAQTLVHEGENGWTFEPGDSASLARLMEQMTSLAPERLKAMGNESQKIIAEWSLDRYCHGVMEAIKVPRRDNAGFLSSLAVRLWKGRVSVN